MIAAAHFALSWRAAIAATLAAAVLGVAAPAFAQTADLLMEKTAPATAAADTDIIYNLKVTNLGPDAAGDAAVTDRLPAEVTFVSAPGCTLGGGGPNGTVTCSAGLLAAGADASFTLTVHIIAGTAPGTFITDIATASTSTFDPTPENDSATAVTQVSGGTSADVLVSKSAPATIQPNQNIVYTLTVGNLGPDAAASVQLSDPLPGNLTFVSLSSPGGWSCTTPAFGAGGTVTCTNPSVPAGSNVDFTLTAHVPAGTATGTIYDNTVTVSTTTSDPNPGNNTTIATTEVFAAAPDLAITKTHSGNAQQGQTGFVYTVTVSNVGTVASSGTVTVTDTFSVALTPTAIGGSGWSCTLATTTCTRADALAGGASYPPITLTVNVASDAPSSVNNTATVSGGGDTNAANNTASDPTTVISSGPDLTIAKTHSGNAQQGQTGFAYTITVSNVGAAPTSGTVTVTDAVPAGMTATAISGTGWTCTLATATCTRSDALAGGTAYPVITLTVNVAAAAPSSVTNTATVSGGGDTNAANNTASDVTAVNAGAADLAIAKTHSGNAQQGQTGFAYMITVSNIGIAPTSGTVTMTDTLPASMTATAISGAGWTCTLGATPTCTRSDALAAGAAYPAITLTVSVANTAPASVTNTATVSGGGDVNPANNTATDVTAVEGGPTARSFVFTILAGTSKSVDLTTGATGGPFAAATIVSFTPAGAGTATIAPSGGSFILTFTPAPLFTGTVVITYTLSNGTATSAPATVTINVVARPDPSRDPDVVGLINAQVATAERFANAQMMNFNQRLEGLHEDGYGEDHQGIGFASAGSANAYVADGFGDLPGATSYADASRPASPSRSVFDRVLANAEPAARKGDRGTAEPRRALSFWSSGYVNFGTSTDVFPGAGLGFTTAGVSVGADYRFSPRLTAGIGVGYGRDRTRIGINGTESRAETVSLTAYESFRPWRAFFVDGLLGFGTLRYDSQRFVTDNADFAWGSRSGAEWFASLSAGYDFRAGHLLVSPYGRIKAVWLTLDGFTEIGDPTGSLVFGRQSVDTYTGVLGARGKYDIPMAFALVSPRFRLEFNHAFQNGGLAALAYADWIGGPTYFVPATATRSNFLTLGLGLDAKFPSAMFVNFDYQTMVDAFDTRSHMFQLKAGKRF